MSKSSGCLLVAIGAWGMLGFGWVWLLLAGGSLAQTKEAPPYLLGVAAGFAAVVVGAWLFFRRR